MNPTVLADTMEADVQSVYWTLMAVFFVLTTLGWLAASRVWRKEDEAAADETPQDAKMATKLIRRK